MLEPVEHHSHTIMGALRYLKSTITQKLCFGPSKDPEFNPVKVEEQVSHVIKIYLRNLRRPLKRMRGLYIYMK
jgi:hypothetical protein